MTKEFKLPDVGEGLAEAEIVRWLVSPGDEVTEDQAIAEAETDKAVVEVPSPVNGTVQEIHAEEGEVVPVGEVIITFETEGDYESEGSKSESSQAEPESEDEGVVDGEAAHGDTVDSRVFASPTTRQRAREHDLTLTNVAGSGPAGRVTDYDVSVTIDNGLRGETQTAESSNAKVERQSAGPSASATTASGFSSNRSKTLASPAIRGLSRELGVDLNAVPASEAQEGSAVVTEEDVRQFAQSQEAGDSRPDRGVERVADGTTQQLDDIDTKERREPYQGIRRTIGKQMELSKYTAPHVTHHDEVDVTALDETRKTLKSRAEQRGIKLSYLPFVLKAIEASLAEHPIVNSQLDEENEEIVYKQERNIGVATATDDGLLVPVVDNVNLKSIPEIASEMNELIQKARERSLSRDEMSGGTFTVTNIGAIGGEYATPIINHPETAILALGSVNEKPRVVDGEILPRKVMKLSLSIDHRVIDGADAAEFTNSVKEYLSNPDYLLLE